MTPTNILMLAILPVLLSFSAFFSGGETALFSLSRHQQLQMSRARSFAASIITRLLNEQRAMLITLLMGNMFVNDLYFVIGTVLVLDLEKRHILGAAMGSVLNVAAVLVLILAGEVLPKLVASRYANQWASLAAVPLLAFHRTVAPLRLILMAVIVDPLSRLLAPPHQPVALSAEELKNLLELSQRQGVIDDQEEQLIQQVLALSQIKVRDLMRPRVDIRAFNLADDPQKLIAMAKETRLSRFPVYRGDLAKADHIVGIVYARQVFLAKPKTTREVEALVRQPKFVPELQRTDRLLIDLRRHGTTLAIVVDEHGGTAGLLTLEDVVEKMVGQIAHPHEAEAVPQVQPIGSGKWRVSARLGIREWSSAFGAIRAVPGVGTVGGLVMAKLGRVPRVSDRTVIGNVSIEVEKMNGRRIETLLLQLQGSPHAERTDIDLA